MSRLPTWTAIGITMLAVAGCAILQSEPDAEVDPVEEPAETAQQQVADQIGAIEEMRGRELADDIEIVEGEPAGFGDEAVPESVQREWEWFEQILFGGDEAPLVVDDAGWAGRAGFESDDQRLVFDGDPRTDETVAFAVSMAVGRALEERHLDELPEVETVDEWMTRAIIRRAGPAFTSSLLMGEQFGVDLPVDRLAERPELAAQLPGVGERIEAVAEPAEMTAERTRPPEGTEFFEEALQQFVLRKAVTVGAALYRSGEWPAVEWGRTEPPTMTDHIVRPSRWFEGDGTAEWEWPAEFDDQRDDDGWDHVRDGRVGPAVISIWLEGLVGARAARTIYGGWLDDTYRIYTRDGEDEQEAETAFHWISVWETPHDAQEVASAMEAVLGHYIGHDHRQQRFQVSSQGVNVAISIYNTDQQTDRLAREVDLLTAARPGFLPGEAAPFDYEPPLYERYVEETEDSTLDLEDEQWVDEAAGWQTEIESLEGWTVQRSNEAHVRWFANHPDGTLIQWTTELIDPLDATFGSEEYLRGLADRFADSVDAEQAPEIEVVDEPVDNTIELEVVGNIDNRPQVLRLWQWKRGDVLVSFSLQGPEGFFPERLDEARAVLGRLEAYGEAIEHRERRPEADPAEDEGIIEFEVGEESETD